MENKIKHLEMIQGVINRMASNSFALKGWALTLATGSFVLLSNKDLDKTLFSLICSIPSIIFWILDTYYLWQEKNYRILYDKVRNLQNADINFNMCIVSEPINSILWRNLCHYQWLRRLLQRQTWIFSIIEGLVKKLKILCSCGKCFLSITELGFYCILIIFNIVIINVVV